MAELPKSLENYSAFINIEEAKAETERLLKQSAAAYRSALAKQEAGQELSRADRINLKAYGPGGEEYENTLYDVVMNMGAEKAKELGVGVQYLLQNPAIATNAELLEAAKTPTDYVTGPEDQATFDIMGGEKAKAEQPRYQIINLESMAKYTPDQYERLDDGAVVLKEGVEPIEGTTKEYQAPTTEPTDTTATAGTTDETGVGGIAQEDKEWINNYYQRYFDRNATSAELQNWSTSTPEELVSFLESEADRYDYTSTYFKQQAEENKAQYSDIINQSGLPEDQKALLQKYVDLYDADTFNYDDVIATFQKIKEEELDPYYRELASVAENDFRAQFSELEDARARELEDEALTAGEEIRQAKAGLEKAGMTFTGKAIEQLGEQAAYGRGEQAGLMPTQQPTEGMFYEGIIPQQSRLIASGTQARYLSSLGTLGRAAEEKLGTEAVSGMFPGYTALGGVEGTLARERQAGEAQTLSDLLKQREEKSKLITA